MKHQWELPFTKVAEYAYPVFRKEFQDMELFYAPAYLALVRPGRVEELQEQLSSQTPTWETALALREHAIAGQKRWAEMHAATPFKPLCLTLYTSQQCNLHCSYCFSQGETLLHENDLSMETILAGTELVAEHCKQSGVHFTLVVHGGGEPTLDPRLPEIIAAVDRVAARYEIGIFRYLATNGVMPEATARWAAAHFDQIGLSCDGAPSIQDKQRQLKNGLGSSGYVERTAAVLHDAGKSVQVRVTLPHDGVLRQAEIAEYLFAVLKADEVRVEPVFHGGRTGNDGKFDEAYPLTFCESFLEARRIATAYGKRWLTTGSRPGEIHGRYCQVFRHVLHLLPGDGVSACFKMGSTRQAQSLGLDMRDATRPDFGIDVQRMQALQKSLAETDAACDACINRYHCALGCPDACPAQPQNGSEKMRCTINRMLTTALLQEKALQLKPMLADLPAVGCSLSGGVI